MHNPDPDAEREAFKAAGHPVEPTREELKAENTRLKEALLDVLTQACHEEKACPGLFDTMALSAYRDGWELAVELGFAERDGELVGRRGFYRPKWEVFEGGE